MNPNLTALDQVRMWCDGQMSINDIATLLVDIGYERSDISAAWVTLLDEGYTQRTKDVKRMRSHINPHTGEQEWVELPMTDFILVPPRKD